MRSVTRRQAMAGLAALLGAAVASRRGVAAPGLSFGPRRHFDFAWLQHRAQQLAGQPYRAPALRAEALLESIDYDLYQQIRFRPGQALWVGEKDRWPIQFFHPGRYFKKPVRMHLLQDGAAREIVYDPSLFDYGDTGLAERLPSELGFAGFRAMEPDQNSDWLVFLGAAYFRSSGALDQYGMSARGIAIDTAMPHPEEFPDFTQFWIEAGERPRELRIYALLEGPSVTGAYRFDCTHENGAVMAVDAHIQARQPIARMGIAPLTSMFWYAERGPQRDDDWRPEVHDSDGLAIWTGGGERLWRPLINPRGVQVSSFLDRSPRGFGLLQRDRNFDHYQDDGVFYERRPSVWVEPLHSWGPGEVQLMELPTDDEIHDNIGAYWVPAEPVRAGSAWHYRYRLHWVAEEPYPPRTARAVATRTGRGGVPGQPRPQGTRKFVIDFQGGELARLSRSEPVEPVVTASRGGIDNLYALRVVGTDRWRAFFDLAVDGTAPVELRLFLRLGERALSETWLYRYLPQA